MKYDRAEIPVQSDCLHSSYPGGCPADRVLGCSVGGRAEEETLKSWKDQKWVVSV